MMLINKIGKRNFFILNTVLVLITVINYSEIEALDPIRMNGFFSGFIAGFLMGLLPLGLIHYSKN